MPRTSYLVGLVGLVGSGIGPSLSPALHQREADRQGLRHLYRLIDIDTLGVRPEAVGDLVRAAGDLGFDGLDINLLLAAYQELGVLYDRDEWGEFRHCCTGTVGRVFFELVQRDGGYRGYGARNAPVRLAAQAAARGPGR